MKYDYLIIAAIISLFLFIPYTASASIINGTVIAVTMANSGTAYTSFTTSFTYIAPAGRIILSDGIELPEGSSVTTTYTFLDGSTKTRTITATSTGIFSGKVEVKFEGSNTYVHSYYKLGSIQYSDGIITGNGITTTYIMDSTPHSYIIAAEDGFFIPIHVNVNTTDNTYLQVEAIDVNPIIKAAHTATPNKIIRNHVVIVDSSLAPKIIADTITIQKLSVEGVEWWEGVVKLVKLILDTAAELIHFAAILSSYIFSGVAFLFMGEAFLMIVATYTVLNIVLSIHNSDDLFSSFGKFWRRELKLFRFFMEIFGWVKKIIKWW